MVKKNSFYFGYKIIFLVIMLIIGFSISISFIFGSLSTDIKDVSLTTNTDIDYKVHLKENSYYDSNVLPSGMKYIASLIDYIDTNISYNIQANELLDYDYSYSIDAITRVYGDNSKSKILFEKSSSLVDKKELESKGTDRVVINENVKIDYNEYNSLISSFKASYGLSSVSDVTVVLNVKTAAKSSNTEKIITDSPELIIPLTQQTVDVQITTNSGNSNTSLESSKDIVISDNVTFYFGIWTSILTILMLIIFIRLLFIRNSKKNSKYLKNLNKILKENDLIIANVDYDVDEEKYTVVRVESFSELRDIHDNIGQPILYKEISKNRKSSFAIFNDNFLYEYYLDASDF